MKNVFRHIPAVDSLLGNSRIIQASQGLSTRETTTIIRQSLDNLRQEITASQVPVEQEKIISLLVSALEDGKQSRFQLVINATGVLLHTNLGRSPLPLTALERLRSLGEGYFNLELDVNTGERGSRYATVARLFDALNAGDPGTLDTVVVNNNAGAVLVALKALTSGSEVIVSRGQLVEIGGGFRVPEVMEASGCQLKEVGTTNRTRIDDYAQAITPNTKAILLVHPSNYTIMGFTETVAREDLAQLAKERGLLLIEDLGSGAFGPFQEPHVSTALRHSHIVTYSGDKLLGGPQAGIISGRKDLIAVVKKDPLLRALRIDKLSLLALEAVLEIHLNKDYEKLPLWRLSNLAPETIKSRAEILVNQLGPDLTGEVVPTSSTIGGGSLPGETIPSWAVALQSPKLSSRQLAVWLRKNKPAIVGKTLKDRVLLDLRTVLASQDEVIIQRLKQGVTECS